MPCLGGASATQTVSTVAKQEWGKALSDIPVFREWSVIQSSMCNFSIFLVNLFIYFWLCWVFAAARGLSLAVASRDYSLLWCASFSLRWLLLLWSTGSRHAGFSSCDSWALGYRLSSCGARV